MMIYTAYKRMETGSLQGLGEQRIWAIGGWTATRPEAGRAQNTRCSRSRLVSGRTLVRSKAKSLVAWFHRSLRCIGKLWLHELVFDNVS